MCVCVCVCVCVCDKSSQRSIRGRWCFTIPHLNGFPRSTTGGDGGDGGDRDKNGDDDNDDGDNTRMHAHI